MVINFAVVGEYRLPIFGKERLIAALHINNFQANRAKRNPFGLVGPLLVWSAMRQAASGELNGNAVRRTTAVGIARYTTHRYVPPQKIRGLQNQRIEATVRTW